MEACKKIPCMISFELKNSPEATSFHNLKQCIAEYYGEDPESYSKEFRELEELRGLACRPRMDIDCCATIKRYYAQLHSLQNRFPLSSDTNLLNFSWKDIYSGSVLHTSNIRYEMASILYNIAVLHSKLGVEEERSDPESMKLACTHFQCSAWAFGEVKNQYGLLLKSDLSPELMIFMQQICFAQAQECILEKSLADNRKSAIIAKVSAQVISFYNAAMSALFSQNEDGAIQDLIGNKLYKEWLKYIKFKTSYLSSILFLYQGQNSEEQRKMGERVALYNAACDRLEEAKKEIKGMHRAEAITETLSLATDIIEGKRKNAKQENEFIYHEAIPDLSTISAVQGANLVQGISFDVTDPQIIGEDIFKRLVPMKTHENLSLYSEEKANILRQLGAKIDERDAELASFMGSLNMDLLNSMKKSQEKLPQNLVDRCAELSGKPNAISNLVESMSNLADICTEVELSLSEIKNILDEESQQEQSFQKQMGKRPTGHMTELTREFTKYNDAHSKASESNDTLRKAMELHVSNLKILSQPLSVLKDQVPQSEPVEEEVCKELESLLNKVEEMKSQRDTIYNELRDQILNRDDITAQLVAHGDKDVDELFKKELKKYSQSVSIIEQNLVAQGNILKALMDTYAKHAMRLKAFNDTKLKREQFYAGLIGSYDVYEDLISKSAKGVDFYKKLHTNIQKLLSRVKAARDVQEEERQQLLKNAMAKTESVKAETIQKPSNASSSMPMYSNSNILFNNTLSSHQSTGSTGLKLKDYIKSGMVPNISNIREDSKIPAVRPSPVGQETISPTNPASCSNTNYLNTQIPNVSTNNSFQYFPQHPQNTVFQNQQYFQTNQSLAVVGKENKYFTSGQSNGNFSNSYNSPMYGQTTTSAQENVMGGGVAGYVNPIYNNNQIGNQMYHDKNIYSGINYSASTNPYYQQQSPISTNCYNQTQPISQNQNFSSNISSSTINPPPVTAQSDANFKNSIVHNITGQQISQLSQPPINTQTLTPFDNSLNQQQYIQNNLYSTSSSVINQSIYKTTQSSGGEFIQNIYKNQLHNLTTQSPIQQFRITNTPLNNNQHNYNPNQPTDQTSYNQQQIPRNLVENLPYGQMQNLHQQQYNMNTNNNQQAQSAYNASVNPIQNNYSNVASVNVTQSFPSQQIHTITPSAQNQPSIPASSNNVVVSKTQTINTIEQKITASNEPTTKSTNMDLLSGIDFSSSSIDSIPTLTPISISEKREEDKPEVKESPNKKIEDESVVHLSTKLNEDLADLDFDSINLTTAGVPENVRIEIQNPKKNEDPFENVNVLKQFHKEVESLEKYMETLTIKTLNGITPLANKWKELQDLLVKDESKRSISVAKLFPDKNRYNDFLPYDHGRVLLPTSTDNYINAVMVKNLGPVPIIMAQIPMENTLNDWWEMVWSQKSNVLVCLHSNTELLDPFWPQSLNEEKNYGEISVVLQKQFELSHCFERQFKITRHGSEVIMNVSLLQIKSWKKNSADLIIDISTNIITLLKQLNPDERQYAPIILNCISGGTERSGLIALGISAILATQMNKPILLNVVDHWFRVCSQRKGVLDNESCLQLSLQVVLNNAHRILNKRGIMTSYQVKNAENYLNSPTETEKIVKDSLQELDPFWKFK